MSIFVQLTALHLYTKYELLLIHVTIMSKTIVYFDYT